MRIQYNDRIDYEVHNDEVARLVKANYTLADLSDINLLLQQQGTFRFPALENGLFPAAIVESSTSYTGYAAVWIRDNIYAALSHFVLGKTQAALKNAQCLMQYFRKYRLRLEKIIDSQVNPQHVMERPHIRFNGRDLSEINEPWEHAQNDALGYFLWFYCQLIGKRVLQPSQEDIEMLALFPLYFEAVSYWEDEDSGHWEESRKIEASSIGVVVASLKALKQVNMESSFRVSYCQYKGKPLTIDFLDNLIAKGFDALKKILPSECIQPGKERRSDSALLFLLYPLQLLDDEVADQILTDVLNELQGEYGIRRYLGDSFWCRDYKDIPEDIRTSISIEREQWLQQNGRQLVEGEEAQWCIFDPIISIVYGVKFSKTQRADFLEQQIIHLNRSLGQLTANNFKLGSCKCPELYYLNRGFYVPNDATPLLWTQANLSLALKAMERSLSLST